MTTGDPVLRDDSCGECPIATSRRAFLRDVGVTAAAAVAAVAFNRPALAFAESVAEIEPIGSRLMERSYAIPRSDGVSVDVRSEVILARWENRVYAFSLKCPHKGAKLEWRASEQRVFCPRHKARFLADGSHVSGRGKRDLDRYQVRRQGSSVAVNLDRMYRQDKDAAAWAAAVVALE